MNEIDKANEILAIYRFYKMDGKLYRDEGDDRLDELFDAVVHAINDCGILKPLSLLYRVGGYSIKRKHGFSGLNIKIPELFFSVIYTIF